MKNGTHRFHAPQTELIFLDWQKMQNTLRNFILEMDFSACKTLEMEVDFSEHRTLQLEWVEMDFSMAIPRISVERVKATEVVITATLMMSQMSIAICPTTIHFVEVSLHVQVRDHILLTKGIQSFSHTVVIIPRASHRRRDNTLNTVDVSTCSTAPFTNVLAKQKQKQRDKSTTTIAIRKRTAAIDSGHRIDPGASVPAPARPQGEGTHEDPRN